MLIKTWTHPGFMLQRSIVYGSNVIRATGLVRKHIFTCLIISFNVIIPLCSKAYFSAIKDTIPDLPLEEKLTIQGRFSFVTTDRIGNIYAITSSGRFIKYSPAGDSLAAYNEVVRFGRPWYADVSNPFKVFLVYQRIPALILLDRQLSFQGNINFQQKGLTNVSAIASSYDNRIWLFDQQQFVLRKYDEEFQLLMESADCRQLTGEAITPEKIIEQKNSVWLYDTRLGFFCFDWYGNYKNHLSFTHWKDAGATEEVLFGRQADTLHVYDRTMFVTRDYLLPVKQDKIQSINLMNEILLIRTPDAIKAYQIKTSRF
jgi:hypothetical protein